MSSLDTHVFMYVWSSLSRKPGQTAASGSSIIHYLNGAYNQERDRIIWSDSDRTKGNGLNEKRRDLDYVLGGKLSLRGQ